jgi:hypothetical protein
VAAQLAVSQEGLSSMELVSYGPSGNMMEVMNTCDRTPMNQRTCQSTVHQFGTRLHAFSNAFFANLHISPGLAFIYF